MDNGDVEIFKEGHERTDSKIRHRRVVESIDYLYSTDDIVFQDINTYIYRYNFTNKILVYSQAYDFST